MNDTDTFCILDLEKYLEYRQYVYLFVCLFVLYKIDIIKDSLCQKVEGVPFVCVCLR